MDLSKLPYPIPPRVDFNKAFTASLDSAYAAVLAMPIGPEDALKDLAARQETALALARKGMVIDEAMVNGIDPWYQQMDRIIKDLVDPTTGKGWSAALLGPQILVAPGAVSEGLRATFPGLPDYDPTKPPNPHVLVSLDLADYPPFLKPPPTPPPSTVPLVGDYLGFSEPYTLNGVLLQLDVYRQMVSGFHYPEGMHYPRPDGLTFVFHYLGVNLVAPGQAVLNAIGVWLRLP